MSFLRRLHERDTPQGPMHQALVMVMLPRTEGFDPDAAIRYLAGNWSDLPSIVDCETKDSATVGRIPGGVLGMLHVPMPIPAGDLAGPVAVAWHWPDVEDAVARHRSHVLVHAGSSSLDALDVRLLLTKLAASVLATSDGIGVYVGDAMLVRAADDFIGDATDAARDNIPILAWVGFNAVRDEDAMSAYTTGLTAFGLHELEVRGSTRVPAEVFGTMADAATYQLSTGRVLRDGDTFGFSETDRNRITYQPSRFIPETTVAVLELNPTGE